MNPYHLEHLHRQACAAASQHRDALRQLLGEIREVARDVAHQFTADEMQVLLETQRRLPWRDVDRVDVLAAGADGDVTDVPAAYSQRIAGRLLHLAYVGADADFILPGDNQTMRQVYAESLADKACRLGPDESVALYVTIAAANALPLVVHTYAAWWHTDLLLRLLAAPDFDDPIDL